MREGFTGVARRSAFKVGLHRFTYLREDDEGHSSMALYSLPENIFGISNQQCSTSNVARGRMVGEEAARVNVFLVLGH